MTDTARTVLGAFALIILIVVAVFASIAFVAHRYGSQAGAMLLLGYVAAALVALAAWGLA